jgi:hypothetical protein
MTGVRPVPIGFIADGVPMLNGKKNAMIGIGGLLALVIAELAVIFVIVGLFLQFVIGVDVPFI